MAFSANGATLEFDATAVVGVTKISLTQGGAEIDVSTLASTVGKCKEVGQIDMELTLECVGMPATPAITAQGTVEFLASGETTGTGLALDYEFVCIERTTRCGVDGAITTTIKLVPTATAVV